VWLLTVVRQDVLPKQAWSPAHGGDLNVDASVSGYVEVSLVWETSSEGSQLDFKLYRASSDDLAAADLLQTIPLSCNSEEFIYRATDVHPDIVLWRYCLVQMGSSRRLFSWKNSQ
jgi:hypothetical protein